LQEAHKYKLLQKILFGSKNIQFADMMKLIGSLGFHLSRVAGSHHIMIHPDVPQLQNLQNVGGQAKPYQVRQFLKLIEQYNLTMED